MKIVLCGGGSGGHITPLLAVARELRNQPAKHTLIYIGEKKGKFSHIAENSGLFDHCYYISAGKLRRYHNERFFRRVTDVKTILFNIRDLFRLGVGCVQSIRLFKKISPDSVLLKGGYVCVPAAIGASKTKARIITHDSDALPGLSNRFAAKYAQYHATGMPAKYYSYPSKSVRVVGLPIDQNFRKYSDSEIRLLKEKLNVPIAHKVLLITGGSNGARRLNNWVLEASKTLLERYCDLTMLFLVGKGNLEQIEAFSLEHSLKKRIHALEFSTELFHLAAISDVIITRAGATTLAEFAASEKACIVVPNPDLTGGHQLKNAAVYLDQHSILCVQEAALKDNVVELTEAVAELLSDEQKRQRLAQNLSHTLQSVPAAKALADLLTGVSS